MAQMGVGETLLLCSNPGSRRTRWQIENENNNVLKNYGYHFEHNYSHGKHDLFAMTIVVLNLLAFLVHTVLSLTSVQYQLIRQELGTRRTFFNDLRTLTPYLFLIYPFRKSE